MSSINIQRTGSSATLPNTFPSPKVQPSAYKLPTTSVFLDNRLPTDYFKKDVLKIIHRLKFNKLWKQYVTPEMARDIVIERMSGALTNAVYCVAPPPYIKDIIKLSQNASIIAGVDQKTGQQVRFNPGSSKTSNAIDEKATTKSSKDEKGSTNVLSDLGAGPHDAYKSRSNSVSSEGGVSSYHHGSFKSSNMIKLPPKLLLRIYGPHVENLIDRDSELNVLARLSKRHIGPKLLGTFANGRFEQFLEAKALTKEELRDPEVSIQIAKRMRELHDLIKLDENTERAKGPESFVSVKKWAAPAQQKLQQLQDFYASQSTDSKQAVNVIKDIMGVDNYAKFQDAVDKYQKWLQCQYSKMQKTGNLAEAFEKLESPKELDDASCQIGKEIIKRDLVFAHNDTQYGNLLRVLPPPGSPLLSPAFEYRQIIVIDFEYSGANVRGFDLCNHFCEWMSDYHDESQPWKIHTSMYPTTKQRRHMIEGYVEHGYTTRGMSSTATSSPVLAASKPSSVSLLSHDISSLSLNNTVDSGGASNGLDYFDDAAIEAEVAYLEKEAMAWRPIVSAHWAVWGLVQAVVDAKDEEKQREEKDKGYVFKDGDDDVEAEEEEEDLFDYVAYAKEKLALFWGDMVKYGIVSKEEYQGEYKIIENDFN